MLPRRRQARPHLRLPEEINPRHRPRTALLRLRLLEARRATTPTSSISKSMCTARVINCSSAASISMGYDVSSPQFKEWFETQKLQQQQQQAQQPGAAPAPPSEAPPPPPA
jgi:hypothetical protein